MELHGVVVVLIVTAAALGWIYRMWGLKRVTYERTFSEKAIYAGEKIEMIEVIGNAKWLPLPWLRVESVIPGALRFNDSDNLDIAIGGMFQNHRSLFSLLPFTRIRRRHQVECIGRGVFRLSSATLTCGDALGFEPASLLKQLDLEVVVYPRLIPLPSIPVPTISWIGDIVVRRWIYSDPFMYQGTRQYQEHDPIKRINWKATARTNQLMVNQEEFTSQHRLMICVNFQRTAESVQLTVAPEILEYALSVSASLCHQALLEGLEIGFGCNGTTEHQKTEPIMMHPQSGKAYYFDLLTLMAQLETERGATFKKLLQGEIEQRHRGIDYLILTSYINDEMNEQIDQLRRNGNNVGVLHLDKEYTAALEVG
jgi:uncharacterized protein (DUF58 family)